MKKYTNKIIIALGIILLICNIVFISCAMNRFSEYSNDQIDTYDEYYYDYDDDDYLMDDEQY